MKNTKIWKSVKGGGEIYGCPVLVEKMRERGDKILFPLDCSSSFASDKI